MDQTAHRHYGMEISITAIPGQMTRYIHLVIICLDLAIRCDRTLYKIMVRSCNALAAALQQDTLQQLSSSQARSGCLYW